MTFYDVRHEVKRKSVKKILKDEIQIELKQNFRYTHRTFQTLITAGHSKVNLKPLSQTFIKQHLK